MHTWRRVPPPRSHTKARLKFRTGALPETADWPRSVLLGGFAPQWQHKRSVTKAKGGVLSPINSSLRVTRTFKNQHFLIREPEKADRISSTMMLMAIWLTATHNPQGSVGVWGPDDSALKGAQNRSVGHLGDNTIGENRFVVAVILKLSWILSWFWRGGPQNQKYDAWLRG